MMLVLAMCQCVQSGFIMENYRKHVHMNSHQRNWTAISHTEQIQGSHRLEKYLNIQDFLVKKIKSALKSTKITQRS